MIKFYFFIYLLFIPLYGYSANVCVTQGGVFDFPKIERIEWINYNKASDGTVSGQVSVQFSVVQAVSPGAGCVNMAASGSPTWAVTCGRKGSFGCSTSAQTTLTCTSADSGSFINCLTRNRGGLFSFNSDVSLKFSRGNNECLSMYIWPTSSVNSYFQSANNDCSNGGGNVIPDPEPEPEGSVCNISSQNLTLTYSSTSLNVSGLTQNTNLNVTCSSGEPQDYQLKLTGSNVSNGRLNFNNGVSAQVSLNGSPIQANGAGIPLNSLTSGSIPVKATLVGTASISGASSANGVLVLEAQ